MLKLWKYAVNWKIAKMEKCNFDPQSTTCKKKTLKSRHYPNFNDIQILFVRGNVCEYVVCKMYAIYMSPKCFNNTMNKKSYNMYHADFLLWITEISYILRFNISAVFMFSCVKRRIKIHERKNKSFTWPKIFSFELCSYECFYVVFVFTNALKFMTGNQNNSYGQRYFRLSVLMDAVAIRDGSEALDLSIINLVIHDTCQWWRQI